MKPKERVEHMALSVDSWQDKIICKSDPEGQLVPKGFALALAEELEACMDHLTKIRDGQK